MNLSAKSIQKAKETYWMHGVNDSIQDKFKIHNKHINVATKFSSLPRKHGRTNCGKNQQFYHNNF